MKVLNRLAALKYGRLPGKSGAIRHGFLATTFAAVSVIAIPAEAQTLVGGAGGLGVFSGIWSWFQSNMMEGFIVLGVAAIGLLLLMLRFHISVVASICAGVVILANAVAIASGAVTVSGLLNI